MTQQARRWLIMALVGLSAGAGAIWAFLPEPVPVDLAVVRNGSIEVTVSEEGRTRVRDVYAVSAPISGTLQRSPREVGDAVVAGETVVAVIEPAAPAFLDARARSEAEAALGAAKAMVAQAEAQLREARALLAQAQSEFERAEQLRRSKDISPSRYDAIRTALAAAEARVASAEATLAVRQRELQAAEARLVGPHARAPGESTDAACCLLVRAPVTGEVLTIDHKSEQVVAAGARLLELGDISQLEVVVDMLSSDAARVRRDQAAKIDGWGGPNALAARVRRVEAAGFTKVSALGIEEQRVQVVLDLDGTLEERPGLGHGYRVMAHIVLERVEDALLVPVGALLRKGDSWIVLVAEDDGRARERRITIGARTDGEAAVVSGLSAGEKVILYPSDRVKEDVRIVDRFKQ